MSARRAALAGAGLALLMASPSQAACDERAHIRQPDRNASLAIGDSVMLAAADELAAYGFAVDARACRRMDQGVEIMRRRALPSLVVVALGSNATVSADQVREAVSLVGPFGRLVLVLPRAPGGGADPDGRVLRAAGRAFAEQVSVLDWPAYSDGRDGWFASDGLHLTGTGASEFARFIAEAPSLEPVPEELEPEPPHRPRPQRDRPAKDPLDAAMWRTVGRMVLSVIEPAVRFFRELIGPVRLTPQDL